MRSQPPVSAVETCPHRCRALLACPNRELFSNLVLHGRDHCESGLICRIRIGEKESNDVFLAQEENINAVELRNRLTAIPFVFEHRSSKIV